MEEPGVPQPMGLQGAGHNLATEQQQRGTSVTESKRKKKVVGSMPPTSLHFRIKFLRMKHTSTSELEADEDTGFT